MASITADASQGKALSKFGQSTRGKQLYIRHDRLHRSLSMQATAARESIEEVSPKTAGRTYVAAIALGQRSIRPTKLAQR